MNAKEPGYSVLRLRDNNNQHLLIMLKSTGILILLSLFAVLQLHAQNAGTGHRDSIEKKVHRAWLYSTASPKAVQCFVWQTTDSTILYSAGKLQKINNLEEIHVKDVKNLAFRGKNRIVTSALVGGGIGGLLGRLFGYSMGSDKVSDTDPGLSATDKAIIWSAVMAPVGIIAGVAAGSRREKFQIDGSMEIYTKKRKQIRRYTLLKK